MPVGLVQDSIELSHAMRLGEVSCPVQTPIVSNSPVSLVGVPVGAGHPPPTGLGGGGSAGRPSPTGDIPAQTPSQRQILAMTHANNAQGTANAISGIAQVTNVVNNGGVL